MRQENRNFAKLYLFIPLSLAENISSTVQRVAIHQRREHRFNIAENSHSSA